MNAEKFYLLANNHSSRLLALSCIKFNAKITGNTKLYNQIKLFQKFLLTHKF
jgi:hypothetical protein